MSRILRSSKFWLLTIGCVVLISGLADGSQDNHPNAAAPTDNPIQSLPVFYYSNKHCGGSCHALPPDRKPESPEFCLRTEWHDWLKDKHKDACKVLEDDSAVQIVKRLGLKESPTDVEACIKCHGVFDQNIDHYDFTETDKRNTPKDKLIKQFRVNEGVTCVVCHGPHKKWVKAHQGGGMAEQELWRKLDRSTKAQDYGMKDLWNPFVRAQLCVSCHVGNRREGKFVTHEMYAAGHPPLPGFEVASFSDQMPRHWQYFSEKNDDVKKLIRDSNKADTVDGWAYEKTKATLVGSIVALSEAIGSLAHDAGDAKQESLDFSHFDCYACHHDLKSPSWRQQRGYHGVPGRPELRSWAIPLASLVIEAYANEDERKAITEHLSQLYAAFSARPFGDRAKISASAKPLKEALDHLAKRVGSHSTVIKDSDVQKFLRTVCEKGGTETFDYDTARQFAWAFRIMHGELTSANEPDAQLKSVVDSLAGSLKLKLPAGMPPAITKELPQSLQKLNDYDPDRTRTGFKKLHELLSRQP